MKKTLAVAAALAVLPIAAQAQSLQYPGFYAGIEGGGNYMFQTSVATPFGQNNVYPNIGWSAGGVIGYDFVGPRIEVEGRYDYNSATVSGVTNPFGAAKDSIAVMGNLLYDFNAGGTIVPYIGAGAGAAFVKTSALGLQDNNTVFAYQGILGVGYNIDPAWRVNLDGRYFGTSAPTLGGQGYQNNNVIAMLSLQYKFGAPTVAV